MYLSPFPQQADSSTAVVDTLSYDGADQLTNCVQSGGASASNAYAYDPAGNRLSETTGSGATAGQFNNLNQLTAYSSSVTQQPVAGSLSSPANSVTVNAVPASLTQTTNFTATVPLPSGTNTLTVVSNDTAGTTTTKRFQTVTSGTTPIALTYDANGNTLTDENGNTYKWDALNRLTAIIYNSGPNAGTHTEFAYDGLNRRVQIVERAGTTVGIGVVSSTKNYLWIGSEIAEERDASNAVQKRFFSQGEQQSGTSYYYTRDHEGSVHEMLDSSGSLVSRMAYDCFGRVTVVSGTNLPTKQYMGYYQHQISGLAFTKYRAYDPNPGRWISRDSIGERGGINLYEFDYNNPVNKVDISGRSPLAIAAVGSPFVACALYAQVLKDWVKSHYGDKGSGDALEHCFLSCRLSRVCGGPIAIAAGSVNEIKDQADGDNTPAGSYDDLKSDFACISTESVVLGAPGGWVSQACRPSCAKCCADKIKWGTYNRP